MSVQWLSSALVLAAVWAMVMTHIAVINHDHAERALLVAEKCMGVKP